MRSLILIFLLLTGIFFTGCKKDPDEQRLSWLTEAPLSIPYRQRIQRLEKENLLRNGSFETGKTLKVDSLKTSFVIEGWHQVGEQVEWVDTRKQDVYGKNDALSGYRSIRIKRLHARETDKEGEGVISEFVKVIPGNYSFSFYTRLENVMPVKNRLGIKMNDAVDIRLMYYDRNKNEIPAKADFPQIRQSIDNSFKSLSFANFSAIPSFGWGRIIGKSADFPFPDGDIPTNAHYVKIFIGLKGTGTMWIDSVNFSYTRKNFSVEERMKGYMDTGLRLAPVIIPTPKLMERLESVIFFKPGDTTGLPVIVIPEDADELTQRSARLLQKALESCIYPSRVPPLKGATLEGSPSVRIIPYQKADTNYRRLVFVMGKTPLDSKYRDELPLPAIAGHPQGYYIFASRNLTNVVFLDGNNSLGIYYAVLSAIQLIDGKQPVFHNARIIDYPDFENRYFTQRYMHDQSDANKAAKISGELADYKLNGVFYGLSNLPQNEAFYFFRGKIALQPAFGLGIISQHNWVDPGIKADRVVYAPLPWIKPEDSTLCYPAFMNLSVSDSSIPSHSVQIAPVYNNYLLDYMQYMNQVTLNPSSTTLFYSGSSFFSLKTDDADFTRYIGFARSKPVFMDNSMVISTAWGRYNGAMPYHPGKLRVYNMIEPFLNHGIADHIDQLDTSMFWTNFTAGSELDVIRLATAADFMWNTRDYDPDLSLWKVLVSRYGVDASRELIHFANQYGLLLENEQKLNRNEQVQRNLKNIRQDLSVLSVSARNLTKLLGYDHPLVKEIRAITTGLKSRLELLSSSRVSNP